MAELLIYTQSKTEYRCQNCGRHKNRLVWIEAKYREGTIGGYVCLKCVQSLEEDRTLSNLSIDWNDIKP